MILKPSTSDNEQSLPVMRPFQRSLKQTFTLLRPYRSCDRGLK
ncbi:hypothetical protein [Piscirickettsia salmonis]|nr:hypothetical protein [Piscirickettsia salmonis]